MDVARRDDRFLDYISELLAIIALKDMELAEYRTIVPASEVNPAHV